MAGPGRVLVVAAPTAFKGTLSASAAARAIAQGVRDCWPRAEVRELPLSDGGDGFLEVLLLARGGHREWLTVPDAVGRPHRAPLGWLGEEGTAVVELAQAVGFAQLPRVSWRTAAGSGTEGLGALVRRALDQGAERVLVGLGGSASTDGGAGMARALGYHFLDSHGSDLPRGGAALARLARIDAGGRLAALDQVEVVAATDVVVPLLGAHGAARTFGPQKGAGPATVRALERGLERLAGVVERDLGRGGLARLPGAGAAGGSGFGLVAFAGAALTPGAGLVAEAVRLEDMLAAAALVITGEGRVDEQSLGGKVVGEVARRAVVAGARCLVLAGSASAAAVPPLLRLGAHLRVSGPSGSGSATAAARVLRATAAAACRDLE